MPGAGESATALMQRRKSRFNLKPPWDQKPKRALVHGSVSFLRLFAPSLRISQPSFEFLANGAPRGLRLGNVFARRGDGKPGIHLHGTRRSTNISSIFSVFITYLTGGGGNILRALRRVSSRLASAHLGERGEEKRTAHQSERTGTMKG